MTPFAQALEKAIAASQRRSFWLGLAAVAGVAVAVGGLVGAKYVFFLAWTAIPVGLAVAVTAAKMSWSFEVSLIKLRGKEPRRWLRSPSHQMVVLTQDHLIAGGLPAAELNRHGKCRLTTIGYDEQGHHLSVAVTTVMEPSHRRKHEQTEEVSIRRKVLLSRFVTKEQGYDFARDALELSAR